MGFRYGDVVVDGDKLYAAPSEIAGIIEADIHTGESRILVRFPQYELLDVGMNSAICKLGNYIAVAPLLGREFYLYNIKTDSLITYMIDEEKFVNLDKKLLGKRGLFVSGFVYRNCFYFVGYCYLGIVKISIDSNQLEVINFDSNKLREICPSKEILLGRYTYVNGDYVLVPVKYTDTIIKCNLADECCEYITLGHNLSIYELCGENDNVYLLPSSKNVLWHVTLNDFGKISNLQVLSNGSEKNDKPWFLGGIYKAGYLWIFPYYSNMILKINSNDGSIECIKRDIEYEDGYTYTFFKDFDENHVCVFNSRECCLEVINVLTHKFRKLHLFFPNDEAKGILEQALQSHEKNIFSECTISLRNLFAFFNLSSENSTHIMRTGKESIGKSIWSKM